MIKAQQQRRDEMSEIVDNLVKLITATAALITALAL